MNRDLCFPDKAQIAREILSYLSDHPDAEDTLEGIVQWWLLERKIKYQKRLVEAALAELVKDGRVTVKQKEGTSRCYCRPSQTRAQQCADN